MPELPEIAARAGEMNRELVGKGIINVEVVQPKCLNKSSEEFSRSIIGAQLRSTHYRGKWLLTEMDQGWLLFNLGMGGEILLVTRQTMPEKYRLVIDFSDQSCLAVNFWWFGSVHHVQSNELHLHPPVARLGPNALDIDSVQLHDMVKGRRGSLKSYLLDQSRIAGIGNFYIHDILFLARLHPLRQLNSLSIDEIETLHQAIRRTLKTSLDRGGAFYELDLYGKTGGFLRQDLIIAYLEGQPCPQCNTTILKIKTGSTSSYICPNCQPEERIINGHIQEVYNQTTN